MKKWLSIGLGTIFIGGLILTIKTDIFSNKTTIQQVYPRSNESFVGDPMPYFNGEEFMIYYLEDLRVFCKTFLHNIAKKKYTPLRLKFFSDYFGLDRAFLSRKLSPVKLKMCA